MSADIASTDQRPNYAVILNSTLPYNVHICRRFANEIPEAKVHCVFTADNEKYEDRPPPETNPLLATDPQANEYGEWTRLRVRDIRRANEIYEHFKANNVQAVVQGGYTSVLHLWLLRKLRRSGIPVFLRGDGNIKSEPKSSWHRSLVKRLIFGWAIRQATGVMVMGEYGMRLFEKYGADRKKAFLVPCEPSYEKITSITGDEVNDFRQRRGLSDERRYIMFCGRIAKVKGVDLLLAAMEQVASLRPDWDLLIVGDGPLREELQSGMSPELVERVHWLGFCTTSDTFLAMRTADVFALTSIHEPWAVVVNEALAAGMVMVGSEVAGAVQEMVKDRRNGRVFKSGNVESLTEALLDATSPDHFSKYQSEVKPLFDQWREIGDPVKGIRRALESVGVIPAKDASSAPDNNSPLLTGELGCGYPTS